MFHRFGFLQAIAAETGTELDLLVGTKGEHPIGILPVFHDSRGPLRTTFSPPPHTGVPHLGPATMLDPNIKYRKGALRSKEFVEACVEWIDDERSPHYVRIVSNTVFDDVRPFRWLGFDVTPRFTYELDVDREDDQLLRSFSRDARRSIEDAYDPERAIADGGEQLLVDDGRDGEYSIVDGGEDAIEFLVDRLERRFAEQGEAFDLSLDFVRNVYESLPEGAVEVYQLQSDGTPVSGRISLFHGGRLTFWQGVPKPTVDVDVPINDLLNWHSIRRARAKGCEVGELSGANVERLWDYKAKYNPELATYNILERTTTSVVPLLKTYKWWRG